VHWKIELDPKPLEALNFCKEHLKRFEVKDLNYIRYRKCKAGFVIYGHCVHYPCENKWYLSCCLPGPFPNTVFLEYGGELTLNSLDEGFVFLYGHEIYHYLAQSKQLKQKDNEVNADRYAKKLYDKFVK
jgi:hypothetical protein